MSQHYYEFDYKNRKAKLTLGCDRRLEEFFMTIIYIDTPNDIDTPDDPPESTDDEPTEDSNEDSDLIYSDVWEEDVSAKSLELYQSRLKSLGIKVPESLFREVNRDATTQVGNRVARHFYDGRVEEILAAPAATHRDQSSEQPKMIVSTQHEPSELLPVGPSAHLPAGFVRFELYQSNEIAIELLDSTYEPMGVASVALLHQGAPHPGPFGIWLKDWRENLGVPEALVDAGLVKLSGQVFPTEHVTARHAELTPMARDIYLRARLDSYNGDILHQTIDGMESLTPDDADYLKAALTGRTCTKLLREGLSIAKIIEKHLNPSIKDNSLNDI
jgi:hypothetical protein